MTDVVTAIRRVTDIMGEFSAASHEKSQGVAQVGEAVTQTDQTTQQNTALVEEMASTASSLNQPSPVVGGGCRGFQAVRTLSNGPCCVANDSYRGAPSRASSLDSSPISKQTANWSKDQ